MLRENVILLDASGCRDVEVEIDDKGQLQQIKPSKTKAHKVLMPFIVDLNVSTQNGSLEGEALAHLAKHAYDNGIGTVALRAFLNKDVNTTTQVTSIYAHLNGVTGAKILPTFSVILDETHLSNISQLLVAGGVIPYIYSDMDSNLMRRVMQYASMKKVALFCDLRDRSLNADSVMHEGVVNAELGLVGNTPLAEIVQVSKVMEMAHYFDVEVVIKGISTAKVLHKIDQAKKEGVKVKAEVSLHHLVSSDNACRAYNTYAKIEPPLRDEEELEAMQKALKEGKIDILTSLHAPQSKLRKETAFSHATVGTEGIQNIISLYYTKLVQSGIITLQQLYSLTVETPSRCLGIEPQTFEPGELFSGILIDLISSTIMDDETSLYKQETLNGIIEKTF